MRLPSLSSRAGLARLAAQHIPECPRLAPEPGSTLGVTTPLIVSGGRLPLADLGLNDLVDLRRSEPPALPFARGKPGGRSREVRARGRSFS